MSIEKRVNSLASVRDRVPCQTLQIFVFSNFNPTYMGSFENTHIGVEEEILPVPL